jgi:DNA primase
MPWVDYRELRDQLEADDVLAWMGWQAKVRRGDYLRGSCPFCGAASSTKGDTFSVHRIRRLFQCFRCKQGGNLLDLWSRYFKIDLNTAAVELSKNLRDRSSSTSSNSESPPHRPPN